MKKAKEERERLAQGGSEIVAPQSSESKVD